MSTTPNDQDYPSKIFDLQTLRSWVKHGVSDGPLKGFKVDPEQSFSPLSTKPIDWAMNTNDSISQDRLSKETRLVLEPFFDIKVFHPEHQDYSQTIRAHFDLGTAYASSIFRYTGTAASLLNEMTKSATQRVLGDLTHASMAQQSLVTKGSTLNEAFTLEELSFDKVRNRSLAVRSDSSSDFDGIQYELYWPADVLQQCCDVSKSQETSTYTQECASTSRAENDLLSPLHNDPNIGAKTLEFTQEGEDEFGEWQSNLGHSEHHSDRSETKDDDQWGPWMDGGAQNETT